MAAGALSSPLSLPLLSPSLSRSSPSSSPPSLLPPPDGPTSPFAHRRRSVLRWRRCSGGSGRDPGLPPRRLGPYIRRRRRWSAGSAEFLEHVGRRRGCLFSGRRASSSLGASFPAVRMRPASVGPAVVEPAAAARLLRRSRRSSSSPSSLLSPPPRSVSVRGGPEAPPLSAASHLLGPRRPELRESEVALGVGGCSASSRLEAARAGLVCMAAVRLGFGDPLLGPPEVPDFPKGSSRFSHLTRLDWCWNTSVKMSILHLSTLLDASPFLREFYLRLWTPGTVGQPPERLNKIKRMLPKQPHTHLKTVRLLDFYCDKWHMEFALYLLKNAIELESMMIEKGRRGLDEAHIRNLRREVPPKVKFVIL